VEDDRRDQRDEERKRDCFAIHGESVRSATRDAHSCRESRGHGLEAGCADRLAECSHVPTAADAIFESALSMSDEVSSTTRRVRRPPFTPFGTRYRPESAKPESLVLPVDAHRRELGGVRRSLGGEKRGGPGRPLLNGRWVYP